MAISEAQRKAVAKYNAANYERIELRLPKGRKAEVEARARETGKTLNDYIGSLIRADIGLSIDEWGGKPKMRTLAQVRRFLKDRGFSIRKKDKGQDSWIVFDDNCHIVAMGENYGVSLEEVQDWINEGIDKGEW